VTNNVDGALLMSMKHQRTINADVTDRILLDATTV